MKKGYKMLNFKSNHIFIDGNIENKNSKEISRRIILASVLAAHMAALSACSSEIPCEIEGNHAHYYINNDYINTSIWTSINCHYRIFFKHFIISSFNIC